VSKIIPRHPLARISVRAAGYLKVALVATEPTQGRNTPDNLNAAPTWKTQIVAMLERNKRYPEAAQSRRQQGIALVFFSLDRQGRLIDSRIERSSGVSELDEEALALLYRAQPFPPPPPELPGERVNLTVPIRFNLN
jgi:protein TonB